MFNKFFVFDSLTFYVDEDFLAKRLNTISVRLVCVLNPLRRRNWLGALWNGKLSMAETSYLTLLCTQLFHTLKTTVLGKRFSFGQNSELSVYSFNISLKY